MKNGSNSILLAAVLGALALPAACTPSHTTEKQATSSETPVGTEIPVVAKTKRETVSAEVVGIDRAARTLTLQAKDGTKRDVKVDERVKRFEEIKVGDTITAEYYEAAAVALRKQVPGEPSVVAPPPTVRVAPAGESPSGVVANTMVVTARVDSVDLNNREVTLTGPKGDTFNVHVDESVPNLDQVKTGDQVVVTYSQAIAVGVSPGGGSSR